MIMVDANVLLRLIQIGHPLGLTAVFKSLTQLPRPAHKRWSDAFLAAVAMGFCVGVATFDADLASFPRLSVSLLAR